jgi:hypothetical protein
MLTPRDGMTSLCESGSREYDVWVSNEIKWWNSQRLCNGKVAKIKAWVIT